MVQTKKGKEKKAKWELGVADSKLGSVIQEATGIKCVCNEHIGELMRGVRLHLPIFIKEPSELDMRRAQLGLAHSYSRAKVCLLLPNPPYLCFRHVLCALCGRLEAASCVCAGRGGGCVLQKRSENIQKLVAHALRPNFQCASSHMYCPFYAEILSELCRQCACHKHSQG